MQLVLADTTFFEGDLGYRSDFIMAPVSEGEIVEELEIESFISGGGFLIKQDGITETVTCPLIFESLKE